LKRGERFIVNVAPEVTRKPKLLWAGTSEFWFQVTEPYRSTSSGLGLPRELVLIPSGVAVNILFGIIIENNDNNNKIITIIDLRKNGKMRGVRIKSSITFIVMRSGKILL